MCDTGMKYDLRKVEDVYYDVKIRGLGTIDTKEQLWVSCGIFLLLSSAFLYM